MSQHDYNIANASGSAVRADINNVLLAIVSNNSSTSAPSTTFAYMWWADTTNGILKIRNGDNNAWVEILQLDGTLTMEDGAEATPGLAFRDDLNTGIWSSAADTFNISTGGTERLELGAATVFNESGADVDFRIEGDTQANLFYVDAGNDRIGIGTNAPSETLDVEGTIECLNELRCKTGNDLKINAGSANRDVFLQVNDVTLMTVKGSTGNFEIADGDLVIGTGGHGIDFSAQTTSSASGVTPSAVSGDEVLDHYERGVWTPTDGSAQGLTISNTMSTYIRIGHLVFIQAWFAFPTTSSSANAQVGPLPWAVKGSQFHSYACGRTATPGGDFVVQFSATSSQVNFFINDAMQTNAQMSAKHVLISGCYQVD